MPGEHPGTAAPAAVPAPTGKAAPSALRRGRALRRPRAGAMGRGDGQDWQAAACGTAPLPRVLRTQPGRERHPRGDLKKNGEKKAL